MEKINDIARYENNAGAWLGQLRPRGMLFYASVLLFFAGAISSLPFLKVDITVRVQGIVRPLSERTEVKAAVPGIIEQLFYGEGEYVCKGMVLLRTKDPEAAAKKIKNRFELRQCQQFIHDLELLTRTSHFSDQVFNQLYAPLYKEQYGRFRYQLAVQETAMQKAAKEIAIHASLAEEKIMAPKEFFDMQMRLQEVQSVYKVAIQEQLSHWQQELGRMRLELAQCREQRDQLTESEARTLVRAPVSGFIQGLGGRYTGSFIQASEAVCTISPEDGLVAECYVSTKDIGLIRLSQKVVYQFDAFDHHYFGTGSGRVMAIDNDFTVINNDRVFRVRCTFNDDHLQLKNGYKAMIRKGLSFQARFGVTERSCWQLLTDHIDNWLNPSA